LDFIEVKVLCSAIAAEVLIGELSMQGFDSFLETDDGFNAYIQSDKYNEQTLKDFFHKNHKKIEYVVKAVQSENWNLIWESHFKPILVDQKCYVRASFHPPSSFPFEIVIDPRMTFGTGHHETTSLMMSLLLKIDLGSQAVLDVGCGTGILSILAHKLKAENITSIDIDPVAVENCRENCELNRVNLEHISFVQGTIKDLESTPKFDLILANLNKNALMAEMSAYLNTLKDKGLIMMSGFLESDLDEVNQAAENLGLSPQEIKNKNNWIAGLYQLIHKNC